MTIVNPLPHGQLLISVLLGLHLVQMSKLRGMRYDISRKMLCREVGWHGRAGIVIHHQS